MGVSARPGGLSEERMEELNFAISTDLVVASRLALMGAMYHSMREIKTRRSQANMIEICLTTWWKHGKPLIACRVLSKKIRLLQQWWRTTMKKLRRIRDHISKRWEHLERMEITHEQRSKRNNNNSNNGAVLEDFIRAHMLDQSLRLRFLEHELRARRHKILPALELWRQESERWRADIAKMHENWETYQTLNLRLSQTSIFKWPPVRPSYLPHAGRQGDDEILEMVHKAKCNRKPFDRRWSQIPWKVEQRRRNRSPDKEEAKASGREPADKQSVAHQERTADSRRDTLFGDMLDEEHFRSVGLEAVGEDGSADSDKDLQSGPNGELLPLAP